MNGLCQACQARNFMIMDEIEMMGRPGGLKRPEEFQDGCAGSFHLQLVELPSHMKGSRHDKLKGHFEGLDMGLSFEDLYGSDGCFEGAAKALAWRAPKLPGGGG